VRCSAKKYRKTCKDPGDFPTGSIPWRNQIHHILCEHAILDIEPDNDSSGEKREYIDACLCIADYDLNNVDNLRGLPLKSAYVKSQGTIPQNLPCHNVDHNTVDGYTNEVKEWLHNNIWNTLIDQRKKHETSAKVIVAQLNTCTTTFKGVLTKRGKRGVKPGGTLINWQNRFDPKNEDTWYEPFSMAKTPTKRSPGGRWMPAFFEMIR
jgi:hypothetical protein